jgi:autotransporter-associated beta strand protein
MKKAKLTWVVAGSMFAALCLNASHAAGEGRSSASAELMSIGFRPWSLLFTGGTVSEPLAGDVNLQINESHVGGGVVELAGEGNTFDGGIHVSSGTLVVPATVADGRSPSVLGVGSAPIALGPGTLRFSGNADTVRDLLFLPSSAKPKGASVVQVDEGARARIYGRVSTAPGKKGNFIKTGPGTLVIATPYADGKNLIGVSGAEPGWVAVNTKPPAFSASGDGPEAGFEACNIADGRLEIATGNTVTNHFPSEVWVGMSSTSAANAETAGHLDIVSGVNLFDSLVVGRHNGTTTTAPGSLASSVNVYGGESTVLGGLNLAYGDNAMFTHRPEINVHGGSFTVDGVIRLDHNWSYGKITVDGGEMTAKSDIYNQYYGTGGSQLHVEVKNGGRFTSRSIFRAANKSTVERKTICRVDVKDGGVFAAKSVTSAANADTELHVDGGTFKSIQSAYGDTVGLDAVYVGAKGMTLDVADTYSWGPKWTSPIRSEPGVTDGGIDIVGRYGGDNLRWHSARVRFATDDISLSGGIRVHKAGVAFAGGHQRNVRRSSACRRHKHRGGADAGGGEYV